MGREGEMIMQMLKICGAAVALTVWGLSSQGVRAESASTSIQGSQSSSVQSLGNCAWAHVSDADRTAILAAYHQASLDGISTHMGEFTQILVERDETLHQAFTACDRTSNIPKLLYQAVLSTQAIQSGAAAELEATHLVLRPHITRAGLDDAWADAPEASRQCVRAGVGKSLGVNELSCPDPKATVWFLRKFGLNPYIQSDRPVAEHILIFYGAKAQEEIAEAAIIQIENGAVAKTAP